MTEDKAIVIVFIAAIMWLFFQYEKKTGGSFSSTQESPNTPWYLNYNYSPNYNYVPNMLPILTQSNSGTCDTCSLMP